LTAANFDCLVLPYGSRFPAAARQSILGYLKARGSFFSTGGYAFDTPMTLDDKGEWVKETPDGNAVSLNTRKGKPGDTLQLLPDQIGAFDPSYLLKGVSFIRAAEDQCVLPKDLALSGSASGYAACAMLGSNNPVFPEKWGRWVPLVNAYDGFSRLRGAVGALPGSRTATFSTSSISMARRCARWPRRPTSSPSSGPMPTPRCANETSSRTPPPATGE
jgi:hypothetical protein